MGIKSKKVGGLNFVTVRIFGSTWQFSYCKTRKPHFIEA